MSKATAPKTKKTYGWEDDENEDEKPQKIGAQAKKKPFVQPPAPAKKESAFNFIESKPFPAPKPAAAQYKQEILIHESGGYFNHCMNEFHTMLDCSKSA